LSLEFAGSNLPYIHLLAASVPNAGNGQRA